MILTAKQAAAHLGISVRAFYDLKLPCYKMGPRMSRWELADLEEFKAKCRSTETKQKDAGASSITDASRAGVTDLQSCFRRAGAVVKPKSTTPEKAPVYTLKQPA